MKVIANRIWKEPAVFIGLLVTVLLLAGAVLSDHVDWSLTHIIAILSPLATALGIRPLVKPAHDPEPTVPASPPAAVSAPPPA